jgi:iron(III) transport system substrate-binding protein
MKKVIALIVSLVLVLSIAIPVSALTSVPVKGIKLDSGKVALNVGQTYTLKVTFTPANTTQKLLTYATENKRIAKVDAQGNIKAIAKGSTTITVFSSNKNVFAKCTVEVSQPTVTVYSSHDSTVINSGIKAFQEKTGIKVDLVAAGSGELLKRIESESANPLGDVIWGGGVDSLSSYNKFYEKYVSSETKAIPPAYFDKEGYWSGVSPLPMIIMYNKNRIQEKDLPTGWEDLTQGKYRGIIAYADPAKSGSAYTIMCTMLTAFGKDDGKGWDFIKKFVANLDGKLVGSSTGVYKGVADGEYTLGLTLENEALKYQRAGSPVGVIYPKEGTSSVPDGIAIIKGAKNLDNAKAFVDFVLGKDCQSMMATQNGRRPSRNDVDPPSGSLALSKIPMVNYDFAWASSSKTDIMAKWKNIIIGK